MSRQPINDMAYTTDMVPLLEEAIAHAVAQQAERELAACDAGRRYLSEGRRRRHLRLIRGERRG